MYYFLITKDSKSSFCILQKNLLAGCAGTDGYFSQKGDYIDIDSNYRSQEEFKLIKQNSIKLKPEKYCKRLFENFIVIEPDMTTIKKSGLSYARPKKSFQYIKEEPTEEK